MSKNACKFEKDAFDSCREKMSSAYFKIEDLANELEKLLKMAEAFPADVNKQEAEETRIFLMEITLLIEGYFGLFIGFSEK